MLQELDQKELCGYKLGRILGRGKYGKVRMAFKDVNNVTTTFAMKIIRKNNVENTYAIAHLIDCEYLLIFLQSSDLSRIRRETKILSALSHPNIIKCVDIFETDKEICVVMDYAGGGDLYHYISNNHSGYLPVCVP